MDTVALGIFLTAAVGLLGSPGPAIAALIAVGRARGLVGGLPYFLGLQLGLATAGGITAAGLFSLLAAFPSALRVMTITATVYLIYLAYKIASSAVGETGQVSNGAHASPAAGFLLGVTNPKAYLAFASLLASYTLIKGSAREDTFTKWFLLVAVMIVVDIVWLYVGAFLRGFDPVAKQRTRAQCHARIDGADRCRIGIRLAIRKLSETGLLHPSLTIDDCRLSRQ
jgi:threonine/homoserine/homoserine lactone efflux protein